MDRPTMAQMLQHGMPGTPGGPVQESPTMMAERALQYLTGAGTAIGTGAVGIGLAGGNPLGMLPGMALGSAPMTNAQSPNIRDVWADQLRMKMQGN
jgi:hypothetical protein